MNNQLIIKGLEIQSGDFSVKLEEFQASVDMENGTASEYMTVLNQLVQLIQNEIDQSQKRSSRSLEEILATGN